MFVLEDIGEAHHIEAKEFKPHLALDLDNGILLCRRCHRGVVHSTNMNYKEFRIIFKRYNRRVAVSQFNRDNQHLVYSPRRAR
jgi:5-methylcytosine-specific restriction endonuclease McrA